MEKRYQVFVSSTYTDLKEERRRVIQTLMEMDCIPAGMEIFPAADEEQFEFIKRVIDDCDYYIVIVGGRYGSVTTEGISYTEKEYDYALDKGLKVIALLHENPDQIPVVKFDRDEEARARLAAFRDKLTANRLVKFWNRSEELPGLVALSLSKTIKTFPAVGWVRANVTASEQILSELNELRKENNTLKKYIGETEQKTTIKIDNLAGLDEWFTVRGRWSSANRSGDWIWMPSWREIFAYIAPYVLERTNQETVKSALEDALWEKQGKRASHYLNDQDFQTIALQLKALGLIKTQVVRTTAGRMASFWSLTPRGERLMMELRTVRTMKAGADVEQSAPS